MNDQQQLAMNRACDALLEVCASDMQAAGAEPERIVDRVLTYGVAHIVSWHGKARAAEVLRIMAGNIEAGAFERLDPTAPGKRQ